MSSRRRAHTGPTLVTGTSGSSSSNPTVEAPNDKSSGLNDSASAPALQPAPSNSTLSSSLATSQRSRNTVQSAPSPEFSSLYASDSSYSIWPEDLAVASSRVFEAATDGDGDSTSVTNTISQLTLGEYHSSRLAVHDRSDTSSPSGVSTSEEDEDDNSDRNPSRTSIPPRRPATAGSYYRSTQARVPWKAKGDEEMDVDRDNVIAHNHGWEGSNAYASQATGQPDMFAGAGEVEEAVANRLPNEIIMNVSHPKCHLCASSYFALIY